MRSRVITFIAVGTWLLGTAAPSLAASSGTAGMSVTNASPCVTVTGSFDYGSLPFSTAQAVSQSSQTTGPTITNCSGTSELVTAHVGDLRNGSLFWAPASSGDGAYGHPCGAVNEYYVLSGEVPDAGPGPLSTIIGAEDVSIGTLADATPAGWRTALVMPCVGSQGSGASMSGQLTVTASF